MGSESVRTASPSIKDSAEETVIKAVRFARTYLEDLERFLLDGEWHTADFLCTQIERAIIYVHKRVKEKLTQGGGS